MPAPSAQTINDALLFTNQYWAGPTVTYSIPQAGAVWTGYGPSEENSVPEYGVFNAAQAASFRQAMAIWDSYVALSFQEVADGQPGAIRIAFTNVETFTDADTIAYAYAPSPIGQSPAPWSGDIWISHEWKDNAFAQGAGAFETLLHEIGHAIGLKHPFEEGAILPADYEDTRYTIMSYDAPQDWLYNFITFSGNTATLDYAPVFASTPMVFDIQAIQARYGADPTTRAGADTYTFDISKPFFMSIYDAGGADTLDLSSHTRGSIVDLTPGGYSSIGYWSTQAQADWWHAQAPGFSKAQVDGWFNDPTTYTWSNNLGIAYGTVIENVQGGSGNDSVLGNSANNTLFLFNGDDTVVGGLGDDYLHGNLGEDYGWGGEGSDAVLGGQGSDHVYGEAGNDTVYGNIGVDTVEGGAGADILRGGQDGDLIHGGDGADWISGDRGDDTIYGGAGADHFSAFEASAVDRIMDFNSAEGDRVRFEVPTPHSVVFSGSDTIIQLNGGGQVVLVGVTQATLGTWLFA
jgi:serralysin